MLPSQNRLPSPQVREVMKTGKRIYTQALQLIFKRNTVGVCRFAFIVGTNVDKRATARNRTKRLLRESVRHVLPSLSPGFDYVFIARSNMSKLTQQAVEALVKSILP